MRRSTLLWTTRTPANRAASSLEFVRSFRLNRWLTYLIAVPLVVALILLAIFFFATFLGLFAAVLAIAALRVWWLRAKLHHSRASEHFENRHGVIKKARIIQEQTDKAVTHVHRAEGSGHLS
jgi:hypothetical protein